MSRLQRPQPGASLGMIGRLRRAPWWSYLIVIGVLLCGGVIWIVQNLGEFPPLPTTFSRIAPQGLMAATPSKSQETAMAQASMNAQVRTTEAAQATTVAQHIMDTGWGLTVFGTATGNVPTPQPTLTLEPLGASRPEILINIPTILGKSRSELETLLGAPLLVMPIATPTLGFPRFVGAALSYKLKPYNVTIFQDASETIRGAEAVVPTLQDPENYDLARLNYFLARFGVAMPQAPPDYDGPFGKTWNRTQDGLYVDVTHSTGGELFHISIWQADGLNY